MSKSIFRIVRAGGFPEARYRNGRIITSDYKAIYAFFGVGCSGRWRGRRELNAFLKHCKAH